MTGSLSGVVGIDALSLAGDEIMRSIAQSKHKVLAIAKQPITTYNNVNP